MWDTEDGGMKSPARLFTPILKIIWQTPLAANISNQPSLFSIFIFILFLFNSSIRRKYYAFKSKFSNVKYTVFCM